MGLPELYDAISDLVGGYDRSIWARLQRSSGTNGFSAGHPVARSRAPISLSAVSLTLEISAATIEAADEYRCSHSTVPARLFGIFMYLERHPDDDVIAWWADACRDWNTRASVALGLSAPGTKWIRGVACPVCKQENAQAIRDGELVTTPALAVVWREADNEWRVSSLHCRACGSVWSRDAGDLAGFAFGKLAYSA